MPPVEEAGSEPRSSGFFPHDARVTVLFKKQEKQLLEQLLPKLAKHRTLAPEELNGKNFNVKIFPAVSHKRCYCIKNRKYSLLSELMPLFRQGELPFLLQDLPQHKLCAAQGLRIPQLTCCFEYTFPSYPLSQSGDSAKPQAALVYVSPFRFPSPFL